MSLVKLDPVKALRAREAQKQALLQAVLQRRKKIDRDGRRKRTPKNKIKILEKEVIKNPSRQNKRKVTQFTKKRERIQPHAIKMADQLAWDKAVAHGGTYNPIYMDDHEIDKYEKQVRASNFPTRKRNQKKRTNPKRIKDEEGDWWSPILSAGGKIAADVLPKLLMGIGDYVEDDPGVLTKAETPESNSFVAAATNGKYGAKTPNVHTDGTSIRVSNREYLGDVYSSTEKFETTTFPINPGMNEWSPWGSPIANQYTNYSMLGAIAQFVTEASDYTNVAGMGYVALGTQYNPLAPLYTDKREMLNSLQADAVKPSLSMVHCIECDPTVVRDVDLFIRSGDVPDDGDLRLYDLGRLTLAVGGNTTAGAILGELWISYDMMLHIPKMSGSSAVNNLYYYAIGTGVSDVVVFGTQVTPISRSTMTMVAATNILFFPKHIRGDFLVEVFWKPTGGVSGMSPPGPGFTNCTQVTISPNFQSRIGWSTTGGEACGRRNVVSITQDNASLTYGSGVVTNGATTVEITVTQIPKPPPASNIFDAAGLCYDSRYEKFMETFRKTTDNFSEVNFFKERSDKFYHLMVREEDLFKGIGGGCYIKEVATNTKTSVPFKVAPWLRTMSENSFSKACQTITTLPTNAPNFVEEIIHICTVLMGPKDPQLRVKKYDNAFFNEKNARVPTMSDARVKYSSPPNFHNGDSSSYDRLNGMPKVESYEGTDSS